MRIFTLMSISIFLILTLAGFCYPEPTMITRKEALEIALKHLSEQFKQFIDEAKEGSF